MALIKGGVAKPASEPKAEKSAVYDADQLVPLNILTPMVRILLSGDTGAGKTAQIGELSEYVVLSTGKKTILFLVDKGGIQPLLPYVELGVIEIEAWDGIMPIWIWFSHVVRGERRVDNKWVKIDPTVFGLAAYEGLTAISDMCLADLSVFSAENPTAAVGGESAWQYETVYGDEVLKMASSTQSHYGLVQLRIMQEIWRVSPGVPSIWTATLARSSDMYGGILGPQTAGKAQSAQVPRWFDYTFRIDERPASDGANVHTLYLESHMDKQAKGCMVKANARLPLAGGDVKVEAQITPASLVQAFLQIQARNTRGREVIAARMKKFVGR
jgi:hypothetical protein